MTSVVNFSQCQTYSLNVHETKDVKGEVKLRQDNAFRKVKLQLEVFDTVMVLSL